MGMYHYYEFEFKLLPELPNEVINVLNYWSQKDINSIYVKIPNHKLFTNERWEFFSDGSGSDNKFEFDDNFICMTGSVKNYESVIEDFVDFINPYIIQPHGSLIGKMVFEEFYDYDATDDTYYTKFYKKETK